MDDARTVLDARLARGEITLGEHKELVAALAASPAPVENQTTASAFNELKQLPRWKWVVATIGLSLFLFLSIQPGNPGAGLSIGNISAAGDYVLLTLANTSTQSGDVVLFTEQSGISDCERIINVAANRRYNINFECPSLSEGSFKILYAWAARKPKVAAVAKRIKSD